MKPRTTLVIAALAALALHVAVSVGDDDFDELTRVRVPTTSLLPGRVVKVSVPLPAAQGVFRTDRLGMRTRTRRGLREVAVSWRVLARWGGPADDVAKPIRWVLATFASDGSDVLVGLQSGGGHAGQPDRGFTGQFSWGIVDPAWVVNSGVAGATRLVAADASLAERHLAQMQRRVAGSHGPARRGLVLAGLRTGDRALLEHATPPGVRSGDAPLVEGWLLTHAVTGDPRSMTLATSRAASLVRDAWRQVRVQLHVEDVAAIEDLLAFHEYTGDGPSGRSAVELLRRGVFTDPRLDMLGQERGEGDFEVGVVLRMLRPLARFHATFAEDPQHRAVAQRALALLVRALGWLKREHYDWSGWAADGSYLPLQLAPGSPAPILSGMDTADAFAYAFQATGEKEFLELARRLFRDSVLFAGAAPGKALEPGFRDDETRWRREPARVLNGHHVYLAIEATQRTWNGDDDPIVRAFGTALREPREGRDPDPPAVELPREEPMPQPPPPPKTIVLDDAHATFVGRWRTVEVETAHRGRLRVAPVLSMGAAATFACTVPVSGRYRLSALCGSVPRASPDALVEIRHGGLLGTHRMDQRAGAGRWRLLGEYSLRGGEPLVVRFSTRGSRGAVLADAVRVEPVR